MTDIKHENNHTLQQHPLIASRGVVVLPGSTVSFDVVRDFSIFAVEAAVQAAEGSEQTQGLISSSVVIPSPHMDIIRALM